MIPYELFFIKCELIGLFLFITGAVVLAFNIRNNLFFIICTIGAWILILTNFCVLIIYLTKLTKEFL